MSGAVLVMDFQFRARDCAPRRDSLAAPLGTKYSMRTSSSSTPLIGSHFCNLHCTVPRVARLRQVSIWGLGLAISVVSCFREEVSDIYATVAPLHDIPSFSPLNQERTEPRGACERESRQPLGLGLILFDYRCSDLLIRNPIQYILQMFEPLNPKLDAIISALIFSGFLPFLFTVFTRIAGSNPHNPVFLFNTNCIRRSNTFWGAFSLYSLALLCALSDAEAMRRQTAICLHPISSTSFRPGSSSIILSPAKRLPHDDSCAIYCQILEDPNSLALSEIMVRRILISLLLVSFLRRPEAAEEDL
ncbi:uncharacterized protein BT62DRAFT_1075173 [Guyanagaster necrorhizus]|uniref:Uncharacterized protein n=1 Tax=Guyanagaster necrorhizus TaxID=856835 RepID=A0A9P8AU27_9AGAR|nr:uncharacterized protein BT62DRAFT_1075173 [Guyanagaster necrorhizus MCA 3950]KAG7447845.1 hypothetical protein BT62DRAFT_1075173 [Guyanagaster necrorhizus MCA 3950]